MSKFTLRYLKNALKQNKNIPSRLSLAQRSYWTGTFLVPWCLFFVTLLGVVIKFFFFLSKIYLDSWLFLNPNTTYHMAFRVFKNKVNRMHKILQKRTKHNICQQKILRNLFLLWILITPRDHNRTHFILTCFLFDISKTFTNVLEMKNCVLRLIML